MRHEDVPRRSDCFRRRPVPPQRRAVSCRGSRTRDLGHDDARLRGHRFLGTPAQAGGSRPLRLTPRLNRSTDFGRMIPLGDTREAPVSSSRSEERRVGNECVDTCRSRWAPYNSNNTKQNLYGTDTTYVDKTYE